MVQVDHLADALNPAYNFCKIFAICPYTFRGRAERRNLVILKRDIPIIMLQVLVTCYLWYYFVNIGWYKDFMDQVDRITFCLGNGIVYLGLLVNMLIFHIHRKDIIDILSTADEIDTILSSLGCPMDYNVVYRNGIIFAVTSSSLALIFFTIATYYFRSDMLFGLLVPITVGVGTRILLYTFLYDARLKFSLVNKKLHSIIHNTQSTNRHISIITDESSLVSGRQLKQRNTEIAELLHKIVNIHGKLGIYCNKINYIFHLCLVLLIAGCLTGNVTSLYVFFIFLRKGPTSVMLIMFWSLYSILVLVYMVYFFNTVTAEVGFYITSTSLVLNTNSFYNILLGKENISTNE